MYCSHCGKKVAESMLFCPFCGEPIVVPEQDDGALPSDAEGFPDGVAETSGEAGLIEEALARTPDSDATDTGDAVEELADWSRKRADAADLWSRPEGTEAPFAPLELKAEDASGEDWREEIIRKKEAVVQERKPPKMHHEDTEPVRLEGSAPRLELDVKDTRRGGAVSRKPGHKHANTLVPPKPMNPNDIFMDGRDSDVDQYDEAFSDDFAASEFAFEDEGETSFFMKHLRGIVGLALFLVLVLMFVIYAFSAAGQITLGRWNLAWSPVAYNQLGTESYRAERYAQAGGYFERALELDSGNYNYASSAAMAYVEANDIEAAVAMLKKCVEINPSLKEPYFYLMKLYPEAENRPLDVTQLLQQGYRQTGDNRLNVAGG